ncbi:hypothetical protein ACFL1C_04795 [Pseudomonadota bacterium]
MKYLIVLLFSMMMATPVQAGKPVGKVFYTEFDGPVYGSAFSNPTADKGTIDNLVFNKPASLVDFNIATGTFGSCFSGNYPATMHLIDGFGNDQYLVARFWFRVDGISFVLELLDTDPDEFYGPAWSDTFPPFDGGSITRSAESWEIRTTSKKVKSPCTGSGDLAAPVVFTLELD